MSAARNRRILLVDDSPMALELGKLALESAGHQVLTACDLAELEHHAAHAEVDLILMDVQMPELYGDDVAMVLRGVRGVSTPIYLLSSLSADELAERAHSAEVDGFITKSGGPSALVARVNEILGAPERP